VGECHLFGLRGCSGNGQTERKEGKGEFWGFTWQGRAYEAMGDRASAYVHYRLAAGYPETFYGQLAMARTESQPLLRVKDTAVEVAPKAELETDPLMAPMKVLADLGLAGDLRQFVDREVSLNAAPRRLKALLQTVADWGFPEIALRQAKNASYAGTPFVTLAYPIRTVPAGVPNPFERHEDTESKPLHSAFTPVFSCTAALKILAPSRCVARFRFFAVCTACSR